MAQSSFPFENVDTTETQFSQMFRTLNAGVNGTPAGTELKVSAGTGLQVSVALGQAMVRGHYYISTATELLTIGTANPSNPRIDTVVLRLDPVANSIVLAVVAGTAAASPVAPTLTQTDAGVFEFPLANVAVAAGAGTVGTITDRRVFMGKRLRSVGTSAARDIVFPAPVQGDMVWRDDLGAVETYYGLYNASTNPGGRDTAGWYVDDRQTGMLPVAPTFVTAVTGTATQTALKTINFSGCTGLYIGQVFSSKYKRYLVQINSVASTTTNIAFRFMTDGTTHAASYYGGGAVMPYSGALGVDGQVANGTDCRIGLCGTVGSTISLEVNVTSGIYPQYSYRSVSAANAYSFVGGYNYTGATSGINGFYIFPQAGNFTGSITIYGMNG